MNCDFCQQRLELYILGELDPSVAHSIAEHLESGCVACREELAALSDSIDCLISATELESPTGSTWDKVADAIKSDQPPQLSSSTIGLPAGLRQPSTFDLKQIAFGLLAIACGFGLMMLTLRATIDRSETLSNTSNDGRTSQSQNDSTQSQSNLAGGPASQMNSRSPSQLVSFHDPKQPRNVAGSMVVDIDTGQIHVLFQMHKRHRYVFWFVTNKDEWVSGGELDQLSADHYGKVIDIPATENPIAYTAVTIETSGDTFSPQRDVALVSDAVSDLKRKSL